jgi:hypothetical protein
LADQNRLVGGAEDVFTCPPDTTNRKFVSPFSVWRTLTSLRLAYMPLHASLCAFAAPRQGTPAAAKTHNEFLYQNRLRAKDFVDMTEAAGFDVAINTAKPRENRLKELREIPVDASFRQRYSDEELCITTIDLVGQKPQGS